VVAKVEWHQGELYPRVGFIVTNLSRPNARVVKIDNGRGTAEQHIKEGKNAIRWARLSCHAFRHNAVRLQLHALAYNLANFLRTLALPQEDEHWSLIRCARSCARIVRDGRYVVFQLAEVGAARPVRRDPAPDRPAQITAAAAPGMSIESNERPAARQARRVYDRPRTAQKRPKRGVRARKPILHNLGARYGPCCLASRAGTAHGRPSGADIWEISAQGISRPRRLAVRLAVVISVLTVVAVVAVGASRATVPFLVYDGLHNSDKPPLADLGFKAIDVKYRDSFFVGQDTGRADEATVRATARDVVDRGSGIAVVDIEHWPLDIRKSSHAEVLQSIDKLITVVHWLRDERPQIRIGLYSGVPIRDYRTTVRFARNSTEGEVYTLYHEWNLANEFLDSLAQALDFIMPSAYTFYEDQGGWAAAMRELLKAAQRYGKPVYPFVMARYHPLAKPERLAWQPLPIDYWRFELETLYDLCVDGIVLWGAYRYKWGEERVQPWVAAAKEFAATHPIKRTDCATP
jgi:hypothetical protein